MLLTNSVGKLGKGIFQFSISRASCRHQTEACKKYCYAKRGHWSYPRNSHILTINYEMTKIPTFGELMDYEIKYYKKNNDLKYIRVHSAGDFYSQSYLDIWSELACRNPDVKFLAFTRNVNITPRHHTPSHPQSVLPHYHEPGMPDNFALYFSQDSTTKFINPTIPLHAYAVAKEERPPMDAVNTRECRGSCSSCKMCWEGKHNIIFKIH